MTGPVLLGSQAANAGSAAKFGQVEPSLFLPVGGTSKQRLVLAQYSPLLQASGSLFAELQAPWPWQMVGLTLVLQTWVDGHSPTLQLV